MVRKKREIKPLLNVPSKWKWKKHKIKEDKVAILPIPEEILKDSEDIWKMN